MKKILMLFFVFGFSFASIFAAEPKEGFVLKSNLAQYKGSEYSNVVQVERGISLDEAYQIAENNSDIDYFVYMKGLTMVLEIPSGVKFDPNDDPFHLVTYNDYIYDDGGYGRGYCRIFHNGDVVFFKKEGMWLGTAPGLADVYLKKDNFKEE